MKKIFSLLAFAIAFCVNVNAQTEELSLNEDTWAWSLETHLTNAVVTGNKWGQIQLLKEPIAADDYKSVKIQYSDLQRLEGGAGFQFCIDSENNGSTWPQFMEDGVTEATVTVDIPETFAGDNITNLGIQAQESGVKIKLIAAWLIKADGTEVEIPESDMKGTGVSNQANSWAVAPCTVIFNSGYNGPRICDSKGQTISRKENAGSICKYTIEFEPIGEGFYVKVVGKCEGDEKNQWGSWPDKKYINIEAGATKVEFTVDDEFAFDAEKNLPYEIDKIAFCSYAGGGATVNFTSMKREFIPVDVVISPESGDITEALNAAKAAVEKAKNITINLADGGTYTVSGTLEAPAGLVINGNGATIDATECAAPVILMSATPSVEANDKGFFAVGDVTVKDVTIKNVAQQLFYANKVKYLINTLTVENSVIHVANGSKNIFDFAGGGVVGTLDIKTSTIYANPQNTGCLYSSQSGQKATEAGLEKQTFSIQNSTLYNIAYGKNVNTHRQSGQTWLEYIVKNNIVLDCGKDGQFVKGLNQGQGSANPTWVIDGNSFFRTVEGVIENHSAMEDTGDADEPVANNVLGVTTFADLANGDFTVSAISEQAKFKTGDPRWLVEYDEELATGINNVAVENASNGVIFNLAGQKVSESYKGIVIKNGKKVLVK